MWGDVPVAEVKTVWAHNLGQFVGADIAGAIDLCLSAHPDYPPTLPQFRGLCSDARRTRAAAATKLNHPAGVPCPPEIKAQIDAFLKRTKLPDSA